MNAYEAVYPTRPKKTFLSFFPFTDSCYSYTTCKMAHLIFLPPCEPTSNLAKSSKELKR